MNSAWFELYLVLTMFCLCMTLTHCAGFSTCEMGTLGEPTRQSQGRPHPTYSQVCTSDVLADPGQTSSPIRRVSLIQREDD